MSSQGHSPTETSLPRLRPSRFLGCRGCKKIVRMALRHLETSLNRFHQSPILRRSEGRLCVTRVICLLVTPLSRISLIRFFEGPGCRKWILMALRDLEYCSSTSPKSHFEMSRRQIMSYQGQSLTWNSTSASKSKSPFWMPRMEKMI
jgi:hypothetical protein